YRDGFAPDSPLQRRVCCELAFLEATTLTIYGTVGIGVATALFTLACGPIVERFGGARVLGIGAYAQPASKPPNIIFILADDLGYADVSCYGRRDFTTPNIDRIAARGMRFLQGYANSAVCSATRLALITGRYQYRLRLGLEEP